MKVLITGGAGTIGYFLAKSLVKDAKEIVLVDNFKRGKIDSDMKELLNLSNVKLLEIDITDAKKFDQLGSGYDFVYHLAAINGTKNFYEQPVEVLKVGVQGVINILEWFKSQDKGKILFTSSNEAYASWVNLHEGNPVPTPETVPLCIDDVFNSRWSYGAGKLIGEVLFSNYAKTYKFPMSIVRFHNSYGPRMGSEHVIPEFIMRIINQEDPFKIFGSNTSRAFCYVDDTIEALRLVMESENTNNEILHIGNDQEEIKMIDLAKLMFKIFGWEPKSLDVKEAPVGSVIRRCPDISKIKKLTGYSVKVSLADGLKKTYEWYRKNNG